MEWLNLKKLESPEFKLEAIWRQIYGPNLTLACTLRKNAYVLLPLCLWLSVKTKVCLNSELFFKSR